MMALDPINRDAQNLLEAASSGAAMSVRVVTNIAANLIAFLAVLAFINAAFSWLEDVMDVQGLSFQVYSSGHPRSLWRWWSWSVGDGGWTPTEPRPTPVPATPLASCLGSSAPTSCGQWPS